MNGFNKVILAGNLTRDPELRYTPGGMAIAKFGLALNRKWKDTQTGEMKEEVTFVDVDAFNKQAETIGQYFKKGSQILIEGRLRLDQWEDKQTHQKQSKLKVVMDAFTFIGSGSGRDGGDFGGAGSGSGPSPSARPSARPQSAPPPQSNAGDMPPEEDDVPF